MSPNFIPAHIERSIANVPTLTPRNRGLITVFFDGSADPLVLLLLTSLEASSSSKIRSSHGNLLLTLDRQFPGALIPRYACYYDRLAKTV